MNLPFIKFSLLLTILPCMAFAGDRHLVVDESLDWEAVFDAGFRPKYLSEGLAILISVDINQGISVSPPESDKVFRIGNGRTRFNLRSGEVVSTVWHQCHDKLTFDQGRKQMEAFARVFDGYLIVTPKLPDKVNNTAEVGGDGYLVAARVGDMRISYSFKSSFNIDRPLMESITISRLFKNRRKPEFYKEPISPPQGYEWYSLDPKINTPDPGSGKEEKPDVESVEPVKSARDVKSEKLDSKPSVDTGRWWWIVLLGVAFIIVITRFVRK